MERDKHVLHSGIQNGLVSSRKGAERIYELPCVIQSELCASRCSRRDVKPSSGGLDFAGLSELGVEMLGDPRWELGRYPIPCEDAWDQMETFWAFSGSAGRKKCDNFFSWDEACHLRVIAEGCVVD